MNVVTSKDGTRIAYDKTGSGPAVVLVDGALNQRGSGPNAALADLLAASFTVYTYDRRGRGDSGDTLPHAVAREIEDLDSIIDAAGGAACVYGISSGAALALEAAVVLGSKVRKLALFEAPFVVDDSRPPVPDDYLQQLNAMIASNRRGDAVAYFMTRGINLPAPMVMLMRILPMWSKLKRLAHTVPYDAAIVVDHERGKPLPTERWASVTLPTLVLDGGKSPAWMRHGMTALADTLPNARYQTLEGQTHIVNAKALAPVLVDFFQA